MEKLLPPITPGQILLEEFLTPLGIKASQLAKAIGVPVSRIYAIIRLRRPITADTALRFARYFGTSARFWLNLQDLYDLEIAERKKGAKIFAEIQPLHFTR